MRRQAWISRGGVRSASALQVWLWLLIFIFQNEFRISRSIKPGYLDFDNLPETNFTCAGKVIGGYYADLETSCQMFHVCTVGQQDEPMDIKFLCLNGTVFDQETRVCERVDEVDCTKSEKFYSLNLELYGSTAPPIIQSDQTKLQGQSTEHTIQQTKPIKDSESDPSLDDSAITDKTRDHHTEVVDSTEDPIQDIKNDDRNNDKKPPTPPPTHQLLPAIDDEETEYEDEDTEYEEDYQHSPTTTSTTTTPKPTSTTKPLPPTTPATQTSSHHYPTVHHASPPPSPTGSSMPSPTFSSSASPVSSLPSLNQALLTPQEFIYHHRGPGSDAISFQRQSFRPADGVFITHAPPQQQYDHFQYESTRTAPRPALSRPTSFVQRPQPAPFRPTTLDPRDQLLRPGPTSQPSERHETSIKHRPQQYGPPTLPQQRPLPFNPYYYDRKRSDDSSREIESSLSARSVAPPAVTERPPTKPKSPPRVIVTASASVSDSNGKRLNYTVGNVVSAVKPIVPINYDDYKESDLIFDPFFLDVPKLQKRRKSRSNRTNRKIITIADPATVSPNLLKQKIQEKSKYRTVSTSSPVVSESTMVSRESSTVSTSTTTAAWNPDDYVDDNYEPHAYQPPAPPLAVVIAYDNNHSMNQGNSFSGIGTSELKSVKSVVHIEQSTRTSAAQTTSSQMEDMTAAHAPSPPLPPPPVQANSCATSRSHDCRTRA